jgi:hypothetical protein
VLAACADFLGIEERKQDTAANYPVEGYAGCRPGQCGGCLDVHRRECEARTACANAEGQGDNCAACVCENCEDSVVECQLDPGCTAIWQCLRDTRCDLSDRATGNCAQACGEVIQNSGGLNGRSFQKAVEIRTCAAGAACLTCLAPQVQQSTPVQPRVCSQATACQECDSCFDQCLCSGEQFGECREFCKEEGDAPPEACSEEDGCAGCTSCNHTCLCNGGTFEVCNASCTQDTTPPVVTPPDPPASCTDANSCVGCPDCVSQCVCSGGGTQMECNAWCNPTSDSCVEDPRGQNSTCGGCQGCVAQHTCNDYYTSAEQAFNDSCEQNDCCLTGNCSSFSQCALCESSSSDCLNTVHGYPSCDYFGPCEQCACDQCPGELGMCLEVYGCMQTFDCMRSTNCKGKGCLDRCRGSEYPVEAFALAEALYSCSKGASCGCNTEPPAPVQCATPSGMTECAGYLGVNISLYPCCNEQVNIYAQTTGLEQNVPDDNPCGLELYRYYRDARSCEPRTQQNPPRYELLETCPDGVPQGAPYYGAILKGCCRGADQTCGYFDDITGLGCLSASVFGDTPQPCSMAAP